MVLLAPFAEHETPARVEEMLRESIPSDPELPSYPNVLEVEERLGEMKRRRDERAQRRLDLKARRSPGKSAGRTFRAIAAITEAAAAADEVDEDEEDGDFEATTSGTSAGGDPLTGSRTRSSCGSALAGAHKRAGGDDDDDDEDDIPDDLDLDAPIVVSVTGRRRAALPAASAATSCSASASPQAGSKRKHVAQSVAAGRRSFATSRPPLVRSSAGRRNGRRPSPVVELGSEAEGDEEEEEYDFGSDRSSAEEDDDSDEEEEEVEDRSAGTAQMSDEGAGECAETDDGDADSGPHAASSSLPRQRGGRPISTEAASPRGGPSHMHSSRRTRHTESPPRPLVKPSARQYSKRVSGHATAELNTTDSSSAALSRSGRKALIASQDLVGRRKTRSAGVADLFMLA
jgi:hypothetical protein